MLDRDTRQRCPDTIPTDGKRKAQEVRQMKSVVIADFGAYTVEMPLDKNYKIRQREQKNRKKKQDREATISAYIAGIATLGVCALFIGLWFLVV